MSKLVSRRALAGLALAAASAVLSACGKKGSPLPPRDEPSNFPRVYPAPSAYPHPTQGGGRTQQNPPPERQQPSADGAVDGDQGTNGQ
jgi:hypothetical protein